MRSFSNYISLFAVLFFQSLSPALYAQTKTNEQLIAASQADAAGVYFEFPEPQKLPLERANFEDPSEAKLRNGLPNFIRKAKKAQALKVAYLGGSITRNDKMYRPQSAALLKGLFPNTPFIGINAGISGSDADLGAARVQEQVLRHKPDLLFIEFAVNGGFARGVEGIIRQAKRSDPELDICLIYTVTSAQLVMLVKGEIPQVILALDSVAEHYKIPSIHLAKEAASLVIEGKLLARTDKDGGNFIEAFSQDGVHPLPFGGDLYAAAIARTFQKLKTYAYNRRTKLPDAFNEDNWEDAKMLEPLQAARFSEHWKRLDPDSIGFHTYSSWFPYIMQAENPGANITLRFEGIMFGIFDIGGPEAGMLELLVDGKPVNLKKEGTNRFIAGAGRRSDLNRFNTYCNNRYRGQFICIELPQGVHTVSMTISETIPDKRKILGPGQLEDISRDPQKYNRSVINLGKILLRGELIPPGK